MSSEILKTRAKRLRQAITDVLKVPVSHSQALELVAKAENYPNWDAACASYAAPGAPSVNPVIVDMPNSEHIRRVLDPSNPLGGLVIVWGRTGQGMSSTAREIVDETERFFGGDRAYPILLVGEKDGFFDEFLNIRHVPTETESILLAGRVTEKLILVDELRDLHHLFEVTALVSSGYKVIVTLHAKSPIERLLALMSQRGMRGRLLEKLSQERQLVTMAARR